jgi:type I restriction enzyme S subunit
MSDERIVPQGWVKINVEMASTEIVSGSGFPKEHQGEANGDFPFAKVGDISRVFRAMQKHISSADHFISKEVRSEIRARVFPKGAIVFPKIGEALKGNYRAVTSREMLFDNNVMGIIPDTRLVSGDFFYHFLTTQDFGKYAVATAIPSVRRGDIASISFSLPPLLEQRRIVAKIEELFSELDKGIDNMKTAQAQLKVYRQALLKHAFEGKLTAQWREQNRDKLETAAVLLNRIQQERAQRYQQQLADWRNNGSTKPKAPKLLPPLTAEELAKLPELPEGWGWCKLGDFIESIDAGKRFKCDEREPRANEIGVAKVSAVTWGEYDETKSKTCTDTSKENEAYVIRSDDFILSRANTIDLVGACVIARKVTKKIMLSDKTHRIEFECLSQECFLQYLGSQIGRKQITLLSTGNQESMRNIGQERIRSITVPICSELEADVVIEIFATRLSEVDQLDQTLTTSLQQAEALRQSILKRAFSGQLVPQDPHDEPAMLLLGRIKAERATVSAKPCRRKNMSARRFG